MPLINEYHPIVLNKKALLKRAQKKYNVPVLLLYANQWYRYNSILEAELETGISYHLIFEKCVGKIRSANGTYWEFENGRHWLKYHAQYVRYLRNYKKVQRFNG